MIPGGSARDGSHRRAPESADMKEIRRCSLPHRNQSHTYIRPGHDADYLCPGGPLDPTLFDDVDDQAEAS